MLSTTLVAAIVQGINCAGWSVQPRISISVISMQRFWRALIIFCWNVVIIDPSESLWHRLKNTTGRSTSPPMFTTPMLEICPGLNQCKLLTSNMTCKDNWLIANDSPFGKSKILFLHILISKSMTGERWQPSTTIYCGSVGCFSICNSCIAICSILSLFMVLIKWPTTPSTHPVLVVVPNNSSNVRVSGNT